MMGKDPLVLLEEEASGGGLHNVVDLKEYVRGVRRRWRLVVVLTLVVLGVSLAHYMVTPPVYVAKTTLQIERKTLSSIVGPQAGFLDYMYNMEYYPTQYKLLESRGMAERVVKNLRLAEDPAYGPRAASALAGNGSDQDRAQLAELANRVRSGLSVEPVQGTQLVDLFYRSLDAEQAARLANGYAQTFIDWGVETQSNLTRQASTVLAAQISELQQEVAERESEVRQIVRNRGALEITPSADVESSQLGELNRQYLQAKQARIEKEARYQQLTNMSAQEVASLSSSPPDESVEELRRLEREYQEKGETFRENWPGMVDLKERIAEQRRAVETYWSQEARIVVDGARADYQTALRQEQALEREIDQLRESLLKNSSDSTRYTTLQIELSQRRDLLQQLMQAQSQTEVASGLQGDRESRVRVVDEALVPGRPADPSLEKSAGVGLAGGLAFGLAIALLLEVLDRTIKSTAEAERLLELPVLASVPDISAESGLRRYGRGYGYGYGYGAGKAAKKKGWLERRKRAPQGIELVPHLRPRLAVSETYRSLRTSLLLSSAGELRKIAVTSAGAGEGKTATSANLAVVLAQLGGRVLLIDADLRKARIHEVLGVSNRNGLVNYLTGTAQPSQIIQHTKVPELFVLPAGPAPPNPSELLGSSRMEELLGWVGEHFAYIVIDTPPVLAVTDATVVGSMVDGVVLCVRAGKVTREEARTCRDRLQRSEVKCLGLVLNAHQPSGMGYRKSQHYYAAYGEGADQESGSAA